MEGKEEGMEEWKGRKNERKGGWEEWKGGKEERKEGRLLK